MSLESGIADLTTATNNLITYFNGKKTAIDVAVAAAIAAVPDTSRTWYVDQTSGLDTNAGTQAAPFKSFEKAISSTPKSGFCLVLLVGDYELRTVPFVGCSTFRVTGVLNNGVKPKLKPFYLPTVDAGGVTTAYNMAGFNLALNNNAISLRDIELVLPTIAGVNPAPINARAGAFVRTLAGSDLPASLNVIFENLTVTKAADWFGVLIGVTGSCLTFACNASTFPGDFAGRYVSNVAAGALTKDQNNIISNLASL